MKILLVEDTRAVAALMAARLGTLGHEVMVAENGLVAVERYRQAPPDLVLMDIEMPVMNGFEATSRIRAFEATQQWAWTPIVFLTACDTAENLVTAIEAGGDDFMAKTVPESVLQAKMKAMTRIAALRQQLAVANRKLEDLASRDGLTGLCNRRYMDLRADAAWADAVRFGRPFGLLMLDVDHFKNYNDHYGHQAGDDCLRALAAAMDGVLARSNGQGRCRDGFAARYGGEEFAVILPDTEPAGAAAIAGEMLEAIRELAIPHAVNAPWDRVTVSIGGSALAPAREGIAALFRAADARLYAAKNDGRNQVAWS